MVKDLNNKIIAKYLQKPVLGKTMYINEIAQFPNKKKNTISFLSDILNKSRNLALNSTVITHKENHKFLINNKISIIVSDSPKYDLAKIHNKFFHKKKSIEDSLSLKKKNVVIGDNFNVGDGVIIEENVSIGKDVSIGNNTLIKSNVTIKDNVTIQSGSVIGADAFSFGYNNNAKEKYLRAPSYGGVLIKNNVQIGNNCVIQRGVFENTIIEDFVKINDLSNLGNTVKIGLNTLIMANCYLSGKVKVGKNSWISPNVSVLQGINIGDNVQVGIGSVVTKNIKSNFIAYGNPARLIRKRRK